MAIHGLLRNSSLTQVTKQNTQATIGS